MMNGWCIGDREASAHAEREMVDLIAGFGREQADAADQGDPLATLARVAADGVAALNAAMVSGEAATEARIALARLQLAFAAGSGLSWVPGERGSSPSGLRLPTAVDAMVAAMSDPGDRSGRSGVAALRLGLIIARCIAALREASARPDKSPQAASAWERALKALAGACLDAREQRELPRGLRLMLQYALGSAEIDEPRIPETNPGAAAELPLSISRPTALDAEASAHAVLAGGSLLPVAPANAWHLRCAAGALTFLPIRDAPISDAMSRPVLAGVVMRQRMEGGRWALAYYVVTRPDRSAGFDAIVLSTAGNIVLAGGGRAAGESGAESLRWSLRSVAAPGWVPFELTGSVDRGVVAFEDGRCSARRERQTVAPRRHTGPRAEEIAWTQ